jgi:hypothetical protein
MKKTFNCFVAVLLTWTTAANGQSLNSSANQGLEQDKIFSSADAVDLSGDNTAREMKKAIRSFSNEFGEVTNAKWFKLKNGSLLVQFSQNEIRTRVVYNKRGVSEAMYRYYTEDKLPVDVRQLVKSNYYDYNISSVAEVHVAENMSYIINIEYKKSLKTIKVVGTEIEELEERIKG